MAKNTNDLLDQLADHNCSIDDYLEENREDMIILAAKDFWEAAIERSGMSKCNIIKSTVCQFTEIHRDMLSISTMRHQNVKSSFIGFLPAIIKCFVNLLMFVTQTIYIDVFLRNLNTGMALSVKK